VIVALAAIAAFGAWQVARLDAAAASVRSQHAQSDQRLAESQALHDSHANPAALDARIRQLSREVALRSQALASLHAGAMGETVGFAARLEALARRHVDGVWLNHMEFSGSGGAMNLSGATTNADLVPLYLRNLSNEHVLAGARFDDFVIERPDEKEHSPEPLRFRATSGALPSTAKDGQT
jgi:Tfp pilus assembly protein PilN